MEISSIIVRKTFETGNVKAVISIVIDKIFALHDIRIIDNGSKLFVAFPSRRDSEGYFVDIAHPIDREARLNFEKYLLEAYYNHIKSFKV